MIVIYTQDATHIKSDADEARDEVLEKGNLKCSGILTRGISHIMQSKNYMVCVQNDISEI